MTDPIVIVGAGQAGIKAAETLRRLGYDGRIVMLGDERQAPYQRPPLSKTFLSSDATAAQLALQSEAFFTHNSVDLLTGTGVAEIDVRGRRIITDTGREVRYAKLLLATGSRPRVLPVPGSDLDGIHVLRTIGDADRLRAALASAERVVIVGGGYIGLEVAASVTASGRAVTILEAQDRLLKRSVCETVSAAITRLHEGHGVEIIFGARVRGFSGQGRVSAIELETGRLPVDLALVAVGGVANDALARAAGLAVGDGVHVDTSANAGGDIYAAGDCARFHLPRYASEVRLESVQNAIDQARTAAAAMLGTHEPYDPVPWFWSDQYDCKLQIAGLIQGYDTRVVEGDAGDRSFSVNYLSGGRLVAVASINAPRSHMLARRAIAAAGAPQ